MSFTQFVKPYPDGYQDFESGGTPVTAAILNTNYDGFLLALNAWALQAETDIGSKADTNDVGNAFATVNGRIDSLEGTVSTKSTVTIRDLLSSGTKIGTIAINGTDYDLYAPSGGGGGSSVAWNQIVSTGTKIAEIEIDGVSTDVYAPSGSGTGSHTIIDENGTSMTARAGLQFVGADVSDDAINNKTIVDMSGGGGVYIEKTLWEDANGLQFAPNNIQTITLSESLNKYDFIYVDVSSTSDSEYHNQNILAVSSLYDENDGYNGTVCIGGNIDRANSFAKVDNTHLKFIGFSSAQPLIAWKVVGIKVSGDYYAPVIYSTEEREIGVWTDGKPLYQKTVVLASSVSITSNTWTDIDNGDWSFVETFVLGLMVNANGASVGFVAVDKNANNNKLRILQTRSTDITCKSVTIQYTKTTDVAGSGTWTPQGVPTHHYSTDEQIIGTWIDGSTLYEKTFYMDNFSGVSLTGFDIATGMTNFRNVEIVSGKIKNNDGNIFQLSNYLSSNAYAYVMFQENSGNLRAVTKGFTPVYLSVTIQYTKSS